MAARVTLPPIMARKRPPGRPPAGLKRGERSSEYRRLTVRVPERTFKTLARLVERTGRPQWRIIDDALAAYDPPKTEW